MTGGLENRCSIRLSYGGRCRYCSKAARGRQGDTGAATEGSPLFQAGQNGQARSRLDLYGQERQEGERTCIYKEIIKEAAVAMDVEDPEPSYGRDGHRASASARKRRSSTSRDLCLSIQRTARSNQVNGFTCRASRAGVAVGSPAQPLLCNSCEAPKTASIVRRSRLLPTQPLTSAADGVRCSSWV